MKDFLWICKDRDNPGEIARDIESFVFNIKLEELLYLQLRDIKIIFNRISNEGLRVFGGHLFLFKGNIEI